MSYLAQLRAAANAQTYGKEPTKATKAAFVGFVGTTRKALAPGTDEPGVHPATLSPAELAALDRLAATWGMDETDRAVMIGQCERGAELAGGSWLSPEEARRFWFAEARVNTHE